jgi:prevent-host-death family protein
MKADFVDTQPPARLYGRMSAHNIAEAGANLTNLIDRAIAGESVVITRNGKPVAAIHPLAPDRDEKPITKEGIAWLDANRVGTVMPAQDAGTFISRMRDEEWDR